MLLVVILTSANGDRSCRMVAVVVRTAPASTAGSGLRASVSSVDRRLRSPAMFPMATDPTVSAARL